jgi:hypothetical protein
MYLTLVQEAVSNNSLDLPTKHWKVYGVIVLSKEKTEGKIEEL